LLLSTNCSTATALRPPLPTLQQTQNSVSMLTLWIDQNDDSLRRWKESLGIGTGKDLSDANDPRKAIILSLGLEVEGRPDIILDLTAPGAVEALKKKPFTIKEGATFRMKATFKVQHEVLSGMKYIQVVRRAHIRVNKDEEMIVRIKAPWQESKTYHFMLTISNNRVHIPPTLSISRFTKRNVRILSLLSLELRLTVV
jgi:hypothetical protein